MPKIDMPLFATDLHVLEDPSHREFVVMFREKEIARISYDDVHAMGRGLPRVECLLQEAMPFYEFEARV